jgi:hypothetical protein
MQEQLPPRPVEFVKIRDGFIAFLKLGRPSSWLFRKRFSKRWHRLRGMDAGVGGCWTSRAEFQF